MNILAAILVIVGIGLIIVGWNGTYANTWYFLSNQQSGGSPPSTPPPAIQNTQGGPSGPPTKSGTQFHPAYGRYQ
jgi:hypothetical protein